MSIGFINSRGNKVHILCFMLKKAIYYNFNIFKFDIWRLFFIFYQDQFLWVTATLQSKNKHCNSSRRPSKVALCSSSGWAFNDNMHCGSEWMHNLSPIFPHPVGREDQACRLMNCKLPSRLPFVMMEPLRIFLFSLSFLIWSLRK